MSVWTFWQTTHARDLAGRPRIHACSRAFMSDSPQQSRAHTHTRHSSAHAQSSAHAHIHTGTRTYTQAHKSSTSSTYLTVVPQSRLPSAPDESQDELLSSRRTFHHSNSVGGHFTTATVLLLCWDIEREKDGLHGGVFLSVVVVLGHREG